MNYVEVKPLDFTLGTSARASLTKETEQTIKSPRRKRLGGIHRKIAVRREVVKTYIRSIPAGKEFKLSDLVAQTGIKKSNFTSFLGKMEEDGVIVRTDNRPKGAHYRSYSIPEDAIVTKKAEIKEINFRDAPPHMVEAEFTPKDNQPVPPPVDINTAKEDLEAKAQQFSWDYPDKFNDLREFIKWLQ